MIRRNPLRSRIIIFTMLCTVACPLFRAAGQGTPVSSYLSPAKPGYYRFPLDLPKHLSANFGELRTDHFHAGIDVKTGNVEGHPVRAAAAGYVARVVVNPSGYGRAAYIAHPNGTTTLYGHLQRFFPELEKWVIDEMYRRQRWKTDLTPEPERFPLKQGEEVGLAGNSGMSLGPHLHFEIRETASQRVVNLLALGIYEVKDNLPPVIGNLYWIGVDTVRGVPVQAVPQQIAVCKAAGNHYTADPEKRVEITPCGYFVVEAIDRKDDSPSNTMGIYRIMAALDGKPYFEMRKDHLLFTDMRYANSMSFYPLQRGARMEFYRIAVQQGNKAPVYHGVKNRGVIALADTLPHDVAIEVQDDHGNTSRVTFTVVRSAESSAAIGSEEPVAEYDKNFVSDRDGVRITIPPKALYESIFYTQRIDSTFVKKSAPSVLLLSPLYAIHSDDVPLHKSVTVEIRAEIPLALREKVALARVARDGKVSYAGGSWHPGKVAAEVSSFANYCIVADTLPPAITPLFTSGADLQDKTSISFTIDDDFSGIADYRATIDGQWALFEYDRLKKRITCNFRTFRFAKTGSHTIRLEVTDNKGNRNLYQGKFIK